MIKPWFATLLAFASLLKADDSVASHLPGFIKALKPAIEEDDAAAKSKLMEEAVAGFEAAIRPQTLDDLTRYALKHKEDKDEKVWPLILILSLRDRFDAVAELATSSLTSEEKRDYKMWKWWETMFGERTDYKQMSKKVGRSFLKLYEKSDEKSREVIADIFARKLMTVEQFRELIEGKGPTK